MTPIKVSQKKGRGVNILHKTKHYFLFLYNLHYRYDCIVSPCVLAYYVLHAVVAWILINRWDGGMPRSFPPAKQISGIHWGWWLWNIKMHVLVSISLLYCSIMTLEVIDLVGACSFLEKNVAIWLSNVHYSLEPDTALNLLWDIFWGLRVSV